MQEADLSDGGLKAEQNSAAIITGWGMEPFYHFQSCMSDYSSEMTLLSCRGSTTDPRYRKHPLLSILQNKVKTSKMVNNSRSFFSCYF